MTTPKQANIPFRVHPRTFKALGADLVTNDVVAVIELVKNAYDAYATEVELRITTHNDEPVLEIEDNGSGMTRSVIEQAWCTVATPYRRKHPVARSPGRRNRRTSGEKGLGRLSAARLGSRLDLYTRTSGGTCWLLTVDWDELARKDTLDQCSVRLREAPSDTIADSGTLIRIQSLRSEWDDEAINDLRDNLGRLLPPFDTPDHFSIRLRTPNLADDDVYISPADFLRYPKYKIHGRVDSSATIHYTYQFSAIRESRERKHTGSVRWRQVRETAEEEAIENLARPAVGPFTFEIRAWDIGAKDTDEIAERFELRKSTIREDIRAYKGISVYRDGVLVLPKSEAARDWLGLDLRRVGRVGPRLSTPQIVGYVAISASENPRLEDTSDRERLAATPEVQAFEHLLRAIVSIMENEREKDRRTGRKQERPKVLFKSLTAHALLTNLKELAEEGGDVSEAVTHVEEFSQQLDKTREAIEERFVYYSRLATVGTIAHMLVHEVRNRTTVLGGVITTVRSAITGGMDDAKLIRKLDLAEAALAALDRLAETFSPLANRQFRRKKRSASLSESVERCLHMLSADLKAQKVQVKLGLSSMPQLSVDPGELDAIILNLLSNAVYWLGRVDGDRIIDLRSRKLPNSQRVRVEVRDSGPGIPPDEAEKIFWPGVTSKPSGIGMGLTVASEIVDEYGGVLAVDPAGVLGGATFSFDLPIRSGAA